MGRRGEQMSDDFGTVNARRGDRAREIEVLRQHYRGHRDALSRLVADAPTEQLAAEYQRLIAGIDDALRKLDELEGRPATQPGSRPVPPPVASPSPSMTAPGMRPLSGEPVTEPQKYVDDAPPTNAGSRTLLIVVVGLLVLGAIASTVAGVTGCSTTLPVVAKVGRRSRLARQIRYAIAPRTRRPTTTMSSVREPAFVGGASSTYFCGSVTGSPDSGRMPGAVIDGDGDATGGGTGREPGCVAGRPSSSSSLRSASSMPAISRWYSAASCSVGASATRRLSASRCPR